MTSGASVAYGQPDPDYRREPGENQSHLKHILKSPQHYLVSKKKRFTPSISMEIGSALHCKVLEGEAEFEKRYILKPDEISLTTKAGKDWKASIGNKVALSKTDQHESWNAVHGMAETLQSLPWFQANRFEDYRKFNEVSIYWNSEEKIPCKARLDRVVEEDDLVTVLDIKTTDDASERGFSKKIFGDFNYLFQAAWYSEAARIIYGKPVSFVFIVVERAAPYQLGVYELSDEAVAEGNRQVEQARTTLSQCLKTKNWGRPETNYGTIDLPPWYFPDTSFGPTFSTSDEVVEFFENFSEALF